MEVYGSRIIGIRNVNENLFDKEKFMNYLFSNKRLVKL